MTMRMFITEPGVSTCSSDVKKYTEKPCLEYIKKAATNTSIYWFGTNYNAVCPKGSATSFNCTNSRPGTADSIASRLQLDLSQLDRTVNITYTHGEGIYNQDYFNINLIKQIDFSLQPLIKLIVNSLISNVRTFLDILISEISLG